ncbi:MAG: FkbM family methyltransferase [Verrucomicrobiota bacterium]|nr:FkbM family methyltransferase [Verrucomicrobiota bacterium]
MKKWLPLLLLVFPLFALDMTYYIQKKPCLIFDVGAHLGDKTDLYLKLRPKKIVCLEPQPECAESLRHRFARYESVTILQMGCSDHIGEVPFFINSGATTLSTASPEWTILERFQAWESWRTWDKRITISTTTLDALIDQYGIPDFCKIDVEGYELTVLKGLTRAIPYLSFEFLPEYLETKTKPCLDHLYALGYRHFNACFYNTEKMVYSKWMDKDVLFEKLKAHPDPELCGDIYAILNPE